MGRGRAKAKQTKVARALKYNAPTTDLTALERELHDSTPRQRPQVQPEADDDVDDYERWASGDH